MNFKITSIAAATLFLVAPMATFAKDVDIYEATVSGITWTTKIKDVEKGPAAYLILRKNNQKTVCKNLAVDYIGFSQCTAAAAGSAYAKQAVDAIKKELKL